MKPCGLRLVSACKSIVHIASKEALLQTINAA